MIEVVARVEGGIAHELKDRSVKSAGPGTRNDVGESGSATADFSRHPPRTRLNLLDRVHIEVGEGGSAHLRIADVGAIHGERRFHAALPVDGELLGKVGGSVGVRHGAGGSSNN